MNIQTLNFSVAILGNSHNPSVMTDYFLLKAGIIQDTAELERNNFIVTPSLSQALIRKSIGIAVEPERLFVNSSLFEEPYIIAQLYCKALPFIRATAVGINFDAIVTDFNASDWFEKTTLSPQYNGSFVKQISYSFQATPECTCNVDVTRHPSRVNFKFNFHQPYADIPLGEIKESFLDNARKYLDQQLGYINALLSS